MILSIQVRVSVVSIISPVCKEELVEISCWREDLLSLVGIRIHGEPLRGIGKVKVPASDTFSELFSCHEAVSNGTRSSKRVFACTVLERVEIPIRSWIIFEISIEGKLVRLIWVVLMSIEIINTSEASSSETHVAAWNHFIASLADQVLVRSFSFGAPSVCHSWITKADQIRVVISNYTVLVFPEVIDKICVDAFSWTHVFIDIVVVQEEVKSCISRNSFNDFLYLDMFGNSNYTLISSFKPGI